MAEFLFPNIYRTQSHFRSIGYIHFRPTVEPFIKILYTLGDTFLWDWKENFKEKKKRKKK